MNYNDIYTSIGAKKGLYHYAKHKNINIVISIDKNANNFKTKI